MRFSDLIEKTNAARADLPVRVKLASGQTRELADVQLESEEDEDGHRLTAVVLIADAD